MVDSSLVSCLSQFILAVYFNSGKNYAAFRALWRKTGNRIAASTAILAMTASSSISVKPVRFRAISHFGNAALRHQTLSWLPRTI